MYDRKLSQAVEEYVQGIFNQSTDPVLVFHNLNHTLRVVYRVKEIASHYLLEQPDLFIVSTAAWFHDTGYLSGGPADHENRGANLAAAFLAKQGMDEEVIDQVRYCILATTLPQRPTSLVQEIVCDADLYHFGTADLFERDELMKKEVELRYGKQIGEEEWISDTIKLLESHHYHTLYCRDLLNGQKEANLMRLKGLIG